MFLPVNRNSCHRINAWAHCCDGIEVLKPTVSQPEVPVAVCSINKIEDSVESRHWQVRECKIYYKIVSHCPHSFVGQNYPNYSDISCDGHNHYQWISNCPQCHLPIRLFKTIVCRLVSITLKRYGCWKVDRFRRCCSHLYITLDKIPLAFWAMID